MRSSHTNNHKALQLCSQVQRTLEYCVNEVLTNEHAVRVAEVLPAPNTGHLLVIVEPLESVAIENLPTIVTELNTHAGRLRTEIAHAINRKKTPSLSFTIRPNGS
jgi:ribosome-binding factor A